MRESEFEVSKLLPQVFRGNGSNSWKRPQSSLSSQSFPLATQDSDIFFPFEIPQRILTLPGLRTTAYSRQGILKSCNQLTGRPIRPEVTGEDAREPLRAERLRRLQEATAMRVQERGSCGGTQESTYPAPLPRKNPSKVQL